jgi:hypothetical protein
MAFLNSWKYQLGAEILVPIGKQELFDSGTLHYYNYGHLYPNNGSKIIARSTTQDRMTQVCELSATGSWKMFSHERIERRVLFSWFLRPGLDPECDVGVDP